MTGFRDASSGVCARLLRYSPTGCFTPHKAGCKPALRPQCASPDFNHTRLPLFDLFDGRMVVARFIHFAQ